MISEIYRIQMRRAQGDAEDIGTGRCNKIPQCINKLYICALISPSYAPQTLLLINLIYTKKSESDLPDTVAVKRKPLSSFE